MDTVVVKEIKALLPGTEVLENEPMKKHTTFRVGGEADVYISINSISQLCDLMEYLRSHTIPFFVKGNGSNLLVSDKGYPGVVIELGNEFSGVTVENNQIKAMAGTLLSKLSKTACDAGLSGLEFASGIPGTVGGAMVMNAGAYDGEMKQVVQEVMLLSPDNTIITLSGHDMEFGYRTSILKREPYIVLEVIFTLEKKDKKDITDKMADFATRRKEKQPLEYPSAGSTFKRPEGNFAGKLIMDSGLKGYRVGDAQVSEKHCGFVINRGNATASDIYSLMMEVQRKVQEQSGVLLEPEVIVLGEF